MESEKILKSSLAARNTAITLAGLSIFKGVAGVLSSSVALTADAVHSLVDVAGSATVWLGLRIAHKKPDQQFTYGYYKAETLASLIVSLLILATGGGLLVSSIQSYSNPKMITLAPLALLVSLASAVISYHLMRYEAGVGREVNSNALIADSKNQMVDVYASLLVFTGIATSALGAPILESIAAAIVSLLIIREALKLAWENLLVLMDACIYPELVVEVTGLISGLKLVRGVHNVRIRRAGPFIFGEAHVEVDSGLDVKTSHELTDRIKKEVKGLNPDFKSFTIHIEPYND